MTPTVGRIVHFYSDTLLRTGPHNGFNGQGAGPYAAMVTQVMSGYINLKVTLPFAAAIDEGSVSEKGSQFASPGRYWEWPPHQAGGQGQVRIPHGSASSAEVSTQV